MVIGFQIPNPELPGTIFRPSGGSFQELLSECGRELAEPPRTPFAADAGEHNPPCPRGGEFGIRSEGRRRH